MPPKPDTELKYLQINDFSPGIVADYRLNTANPASQIVMDAMKPGEAVFRETVGGTDYFTRGCIANAEGKLCALPYLANTRFANQNIGTDSFVDTAGLAVVPIRNADVLVAWIHTVAQAPLLDTLRTFVGNTNVVTQQGTLATNGPPRGITHALSRGKRSGFSTPAGPELFWEWTSGEPHTDGSVQFYSVFPDPNNLAVDGAFTETGTVANAALLLGGQILGHDGRIVRLCEQTHSWGTRSFWSNERVRYTDPPNSVSLAATTTDSILDPQTPNTIGAWGSLTYGELILIKQYGGALLVEGDIYAPQITRLPGVQSTGTHMSETASCAAGLVYMTDDGPYLWTGGSSSQRLGYPAGAIIPLSANSTVNGGSGITCSVQQFNNYVVFSGGAIWDAVHGTWWALNVPYATTPLVFFAASQVSQGVLYGIINGQVGVGVEIWQYVPNQPAQQTSQMTWLSQPLQTGLETIDIMSVELSLSAIPSTFVGITVEVDFVTIDGTMQRVGTFTPAPTNFTPTWRLRSPVGIRAHHIQPYIKVANTAGNLPVISDIVVGYREAGPLGPGTHS